MRFLIDADLPRSTRAVVERHGHEAIDIRDTLLRGATDAEVAAHARAIGACLVTGDFDFADIRNYPPASYQGIVVVVPPRNATAGVITDLIGRFVGQGPLDRLAGRLAIVEPGRVRLRPR